MSVDVDDPVYSRWVFFIFFFLENYSLIFFVVSIFTSIFIFLFLGFFIEVLFVLNFIILPQFIKYYIFQFDYYSFIFTSILLNWFFFCNFTLQSKNCFLFYFILILIPLIFFGSFCSINFSFQLHASIKKNYFVFKFWFLFFNSYFFSLDSFV